MQKLKVITALLIVPASILFQLGLSGQAVAFSPVVATSALKQDACGGLNQLSGRISSNCSNLSSTGNGVNSLAKTIVNILSLVIGIIAVIMIIVSGLKLVTSGGDPQKAGSARSTLVYALIGLAIAALAQLIVHFVLNALVSGTVSASS